MNAKILLLLLSANCILAPTGILAQGFAGLGSNAEGFSIPKRGVPLVFPGDHGAHPDFRIEWWYVTANLQKADGQRMGAQWTLFRSALQPTERAGWTDPHIWIGHAAVTTASGHYVTERLARGGVGQAGVDVEPFEAWIDNWQMKSTGTDLHDPLDQLELNADGNHFQYNLKLRALGPLIRQGDGGYSVKSAEGQASYYYSQPFYDVSGSVRVDGDIQKVTGKAWLDREWSSQPLAANQTGWDWFSLHLTSGEKLMAFRLRDDNGGYISANWISADGKTTTIDPGDIILTPLRTADVKGKAVPVEWSIRIPGRGLDIKTLPLNEQAWMATSTPYWEGPIEFKGSISGQGYLEMTGY
ncbi:MULTISPECIES: lipocalin-like domain-containing protein [Agrobacterium tumefaciens complex]|uniref:Secreted hydrolase n=2 Tax=Agrobacterium tumefaciens complex TaxID=1183400 RepID=A0AAW8M0G0_AGRTU|nr:MULTISPECIES: lipocalin-like domain-containing protein [Agrobacterium tumefaciens complex]EPR23263.1 iron ABC transporter permease [Agrobacterium radiobacter DSM 30147]KAB0459166.1 iron ABC transporter permease [Agrobacterium tumefaciens]KWT75368.1 iron ABC transporter permease [Agrobacterium radiobacter]MBB4320655.1 putative secreted hydrolase [Agrobacterium radiobacter]MBB4337319.1 putative secreted hydrolase [Agrobacterium radiobacter]